VGEIVQVQKARDRVVIGIPAGDDVKTGFAHDLAYMIGSTSLARPDIELHLHTYKSTLIPSSRHNLVLQAAAVEAKHLLFVDSDMRFPPDALLRLLSHKQPIVAANYATRRAPVQTVAERDGKRLVLAPDASGLIEVDWVGTGLMLVDMDVFKTLPAPWFHLMYHPEESSYSGEDVWFCRHARAHGIRVLVDQDLSHQVGHVGEFVYRHEHVRAVNT
jgi:hypothetical protein